MNAIRHLMRKDWLARRSLLLMWYGVLVLGLLGDLGLADIQFAGSHQQRLMRVLLGPFLLGTFTVVWAVLIASSSVREDTPAVLERFLSTRPVPPRSLWISKALFLLLALVLPLLGKNILYLAFSGQELRTVLLGTLQMALWVVPATALTAAFAALWATIARLVAAITTMIIVGWGCALAADLLLPRSAVRDDLLDAPLTFACALGLAALAFVLLTTSRRMLLQPLRTMLPLAVMIPLGGLAFWLFGPAMNPVMEAVGPGPELPATGELSPSEAGHQYSWWSQSSGRTNGLTLRLNLDRPSKLPASQELAWQFSETRCNGKSYPQPVRSPGELLVSGDLVRQLSDPMIHVTEHHLGQKLRWMTDHFSRASLAGPQVTSRPVPAEPGSDQLLEFSADLQGTIYEWEVAADLPLQAGHSVEGEQERWTVLNVSLPRRGGLALALDCSRTELWLSKRPGEQASPAGRYGRDIAFVLSAPSRGRAYFERNHFSPQSRAAGSGYVQRSFSLTFNGNQELTQFLGDSTDDLRVLILRPRYAGSIARRWTGAPGMRPAYLTSYHGGGLARREKLLSAGQFARWFGQVEKPSPESSPEAISQFLVSVLEKSAHCRSSIAHDDPIVGVLARYVPGHLDLFLRARQALAMDDHTPQRLLDRTLILGCTPSQTGRLVEAIRTDPDLLEILVARGWSREALPTLMEKFHAGRVDSRMLSVLARFGKLEPFVPSLLAGLRRNPDTSTYNLLRSLPGLETRLDASVRAMWEERPRAMLSDDPFNSSHLKVAILHGLQGALDELHVLTRQTREERPNDLHNADNLLREQFLQEIPKSDRRQDEVLVDWFLAHSPEQFHFDPISRRFALKPRSL